MSEFRREKINEFLGIVRKYMQVRGSMSQKQLSELSGYGDSTMSRFLNQKTNDLNSQMIAKIVAVLNVPLHEVIDFVDEEFTDKFKRLVLFYKEESSTQNGEIDQAVLSETSPGTQHRMGEGKTEKIVAQIQTGPGRMRNIPFGGENEKVIGPSLISENFESLSAKQRLYIKDFFDLDHDGKDLIVDVGNNVIRYIRQKGLE